MDFIIKKLDKKKGFDMEQQIQDLVSSIKKEGIDEANRQSADIIAKANAEAEKIIADAKKESARLIEEAKNECALRDESGRATLQQAARDVALSLKKSIEAQISKLLSSNVSAAMDKELIAKLIKEVVASSLNDVTIEISAKDADALVASLKAQLASDLKGGLVLKTGASGSGLVIRSNDGSGYVDLSAEEIAGLMKPYLSDSLKEIVFA